MHEGDPSPNRLPTASASDIVTNIFMPTTIHLPKPLLDAVDRRARALRISRNRLIRRALERELSLEGDWSPGFFDRLSERDEQVVEAADELLKDVVRRRRSKAPPNL